MNAPDVLQVLKDRMNKLDSPPAGVAVARSVPGQLLELLTSSPHQLGGAGRGLFSALKSEGTATFTGGKETNQATNPST